MFKSTNLVSPITSGQVKFLFEFPAAKLAERYLSELSIDVGRLLHKTDQISVYECEDTGFRFFFPFDLAGDTNFYQELEKISWYYASWKWDYQVAKEYIKEYSRVLDIGCGEAKFLDYLKKHKNSDCTGLELNIVAMEIGKKKGINVLKQTIQEHVKESSNKYDVVTFFQVLEHIPDVIPFFSSAVSVVKNEGLIILTVPNNDPYYLTFDKYHLLNLPPHHMGWWNEQSLVALGKKFGLRILEIRKQPLEHYSAYTNNFIRLKLKIAGFWGKIIHPFLKLYFYLNRKRICGASILVVFQKKQ